MLTRVLTLLVAVLLVGADPGSDALSAHGQLTDLDGMSEAELLRDLVAEIDDIIDGHDPDEIVDGDVVEEVIVALHDDGDSGDEAAIDFEDIEAEMDEADLSLEEIIEGALEVSAAGGRRGGAFMVAAGNAAPPRRKEAPSRVARALVMAIKTR